MGSLGWLIVDGVLILFAAVAIFGCLLILAVAVGAVLVRCVSAIRWAWQGPEPERGGSAELPEQMQETE